MMRSAAVVFLVAIFGSALSASLPSYIKPCKRDDPKLNECALKRAQEAIPTLIKGDPKYGIPKLEPLVIDRIVVGDGKQGNGGLGITFSCNNCKIHGIKDLQAKKVIFDLKKKQIELEGSVPKVDIKGKYTASGKVLILPITGEGDADLKLSDVKLGYKVSFDLKKGKDGKEYINLKNPKLEIKAKGLNIKLTNLFNGDKTLGNQMNIFLNENWQDLLKEFGPAVADSVGKILTNVVNNIAGKVPFDEVFPK